MSMSKHYRDATITLSSLQQDLLDAAKEMRCAARDMNEAVSRLNRREDEWHKRLEELLTKLERREELRTKRFEELMVVLAGDDDERLIAAE